MSRQFSTSQIIEAVSPLLGTTDRFRRPKRPHDAIASEISFSHRLPSPRPRHSPQLPIASSSDEMASRLRQRDSERPHTPIMLRRFIGDGLDLRRPANYGHQDRGSEGEAMVIDLTSDAEEVSEQEQEQEQEQDLEEERSTPPRSTAFPLNRANGLPRFPGNEVIIDLSTDSPPQPRRRPVDRGATTTNAESPEIEFVGSRTLPRLPVDAQGEVPGIYIGLERGQGHGNDDMFENEALGLGDDAADDEVIYTGTAARDPATLAPRLAFLEAEHRQLRAQRHRLARERRAADLRGRAILLRTEVEHHANLMGAVRREDRRRIQQQVDQIRAESRRMSDEMREQHLNRLTRRIQLQEFHMPNLDFGAVGFNMGGERETPPAPTYASPCDAPEGFTRSPEEKDFIICPNCKDELCTGEEEEKKQVWAIRACGHLYCGFCTNHRSKSKRIKDPRDPKGKRPAISLPPPFTACVVEGCAKKVGKGTMIQLFL